MWSSDANCQKCGCICRLVRGLWPFGIERTYSVCSSVVATHLHLFFQVGTRWCRKSACMQIGGDCVTKCNHKIKHDQGNNLKGGYKRQIKNDRPSHVTGKMEKVCR